MGGGKKTALQGATNTATAASAQEDQRAKEMQAQQQQTRTAAATNAASAGEGVTGAIGDQMTAGKNLTNTPQVSNADITNSSFGRGREGYQQFADTGGYSDADKQAFLRSSTRGATAGYSANEDELNRRLAVQGGYMPGFTSSAAKLTRASSNAAGEAATNANATINAQVNQNKLAGLGGLETTRQAAGNEALQKQQQQLTAQTAGATANQGAINSLLDYYKANLNTMSDADKLQLQNRLVQLGMTQAQINAFLGSASQQASGLQTFTNIAGAVGGLAGGTGGLITGVSGGKGL